MSEWSSEVWEIEEKSIIKYGDREKRVEGEITAEVVKEFARELGLKKFIVKDEDGNTLTPNDFPVMGTIIIEEYNEAKNY